MKVAANFERIKSFAIVGIDYGNPAGIRLADNQLTGFCKQQHVLGWALQFEAPSYDPVVWIEFADCVVSRIRNEECPSLRIRNHIFGDRSRSDCARYVAAVEVYQRDGIKAGMRHCRKALIYRNANMVNNAGHFGAAQYFVAVGIDQGDQTRRGWLSHCSAAVMGFVIFLGNLGGLGHLIASGFRKTAGHQNASFRCACQPVNIVKPFYAARHLVIFVQMKNRSELSLRNVDIGYCSAASH
ncbi:MAG: hypothetical protein CMN17_13445 [Roseovarius sp.]|nr:hypothetical protein [Roseovarius sp.]